MNYLGAGSKLVTENLSQALFIKKIIKFKLFLIFGFYNTDK